MPGVFYDMLICLRGHLPIRKCSPGVDQGAPTVRNRVDCLRLSSDPALVAGFSFVGWATEMPADADQRSGRGAAAIWLASSGPIEPSAGNLSHRASAPIGATDAPH
jgi:hypothetical protein